MASIKQNNDGTISITLPAVLYKVTDAYLQNTTRDVVLENLNKAYNREVEQVEDLVQQAIAQADTFSLRHAKEKLVPYLIRYNAR